MTKRRYIKGTEVFRDEERVDPVSPSRLTSRSRFRVGGLQWWIRTSPSFESKLKSKLGKGAELGWDNCRSRGFEPPCMNNQY